ncbi:hypothetical protein RclHR1_00010008 [Rhizophagus clarus]|uniref:F-box domain-containing protein n=1 Tax=Rhizophagus clarus TaxID=94130 RepID=A0A2Z6QS66_9GLOM|nr:hypothetical protein RclHR1_00010008 [Rhizophagus clarus]GES75202.1 hypothetical protein GLOIN_2v1761545 [Rhizophagus clarus]
MSKLNGDICYLILKNLQDDINTLHSCLLVNKTWCEIVVRILWKNPWKYLWFGDKKLKQLLLTVIIPNLSDNLRNNLSQKFDFFKDSYQKPLFDYISFCRHLNLNEIKRGIVLIFEGYETSTIENEILSIFINENRKFTHLYVPILFDFQLHTFSGAEQCFSELQYLNCRAFINDNALAGLIEICGSIKELTLLTEACKFNNYEIVKLIETLGKLSTINLLTPNSLYVDNKFYEAVEKSLIKHANSVQYLRLNRPFITDNLSSFINLKSLVLYGSFREDVTWNCLKNLSLPFLQVLRARNIPINLLARLISTTNENLIEIDLDRMRDSEFNNKEIIRPIYQNCPKLEYFKIILMNHEIFELEKLLIRCHHLNELFILVRSTIDWNSLFEILTKSSPNKLFSFKLDFGKFPPKLESLRLFFENWKGRNPMSLQAYLYKKDEHIDLIEKYKAEGIVKTYGNIHLFSY